MQANEIRLGVLSALLGGVLAAGIGALTINRSSADSTPAVPEAAPVQTVIVNPPEVVVPGYTGALYDAQGRVVGVAVERKATAAPVASGSSGSAAVTSSPGRSKTKSAAIIAGSAGAGAAIGAIAGGGKGAAIGAISGGAAGLIYDRTTANKKK
jgi:hypothetical protein